jgi:hypothetical protein
MTRSLFSLLGRTALVFGLAFVPLSDVCAGQDIVIDNKTISHNVHGNGNSGNNGSTPILLPADDNSVTINNSTVGNLRFVYGGYDNSAGSAAARGNTVKTSNRTMGGNN